MKHKHPSNEALREKSGVIDQRSQQIDPAGRHRVDVNESAKGSQKQPGQDKHPKKRTEQMPNEPKSAAKKRPGSIRRENGQGDHEGAPHAPKEFDVMNPQKQIPDADKKSRTPTET